jgi:hypothetical protein
MSGLLFAKVEVEKQRSQGSLAGLLSQALSSSVDPLSTVTAASSSGASRPRSPVKSHSLSVLNVRTKLSAAQFAADLREPHPPLSLQCVDAILAAASSHAGGADVWDGAEYALLVAEDDGQVDVDFPEVRVH